MRPWLAEGVLGLVLAPRGYFGSRWLMTASGGDQEVLAYNSRREVPPHTHTILLHPLWARPGDCRKEVGHPGAAGADV